MIRIILIFLIATFLSPFSLMANHFGGIGGIGGAIDFDHDPIYKEVVEQYHVPVTECKIQRDRLYHLNSVNVSYDEIFSLTAQTILGHNLVNEVKRKMSEGKLLIKDLSYSERLKRKLSPKTSALYDVSEKTPTIYLDPKHELGLVVHFFVHEASHALDSLIFDEYQVDLELYNEYKKVYELLGLSKNPYKLLSDSETQQISYVYEEKERSSQQHAYRAERFAFDQQGEFTKEILNFNDCYNSYVDEHRKKNGLKLFEKTSDEFILSAYNINKKYLNK